MLEQSALLKGLNKFIAKASDMSKRGENTITPLI